MSHHESTLTHPVSFWQCAEPVFYQLGRDDVLVGLPVLSVELLGPVPDGLHLCVLRELIEGRLAALAVLENQPPVPLGQGGEGHGEGLATIQGCLGPKYPSPEKMHFRSVRISRSSHFKTRITTALFLASSFFCGRSFSLLLDTQTERYNILIQTQFGKYNRLTNKC